MSQVAEFLRTIEKKCIGCGNLFQGIALVPVSRCPSCIEGDAAEAEREAREQPMREREALTLASIPPRYLWAAFGSSMLASRVTGDESVIVAATTALDVLSVVINGPSGSGKTSLACAMMRARSEKERRRGMFVTAFALAKARTEHKLGSGEAPLVEKAAAAPILVLDELGAEYARNTAIQEVIHDRYEQELPTIYTTPFQLPMIAERYGDGIARRIFEGARVIEIGFAQASLDLRGES